MVQTVKSKPMPETLSLALRPTKLDDLYGQAATVKAIRKQVATRPPSYWMLQGPPGTGKTTLAQILGQSFNCTHQTPETWGTPCAACRVPLVEINASDVNGVEEISKIAEMSRYRPATGSKRIIILDEAQRISTAAQNLLLKPFEVKNSTTVWIICTTEPSKILPALRRRCTSYTMKLLTMSEVPEFVRDITNKNKLPPRDNGPLCEQLALNSINSPGLILQALDKYLAGNSAAASVGNTDGSSVNTLRICKAVTSGDWKTVKTALAEANSDDAYAIRASVAGWLKGFMMRESDPSKLDRAAKSILDLTTSAPYDEKLMLAWLWPILFNITKRYGR